MACENVLRSSLEGGRFAINIEFTAPDLSESADDVLRLAELAAADARVAAIAITDRVPSITTHDPVDLAVRVAEVSGKMPLVHLSGKNRTAENMRRQFERMGEHGLENALVVTGDVPRVEGPDPMSAAPDGILDSVQAISMAREAAPPLFIAAAVSSFKYSEPQQMLQYLKMTKKVLAGAGAIYNQVGYDLRKADELPRYARHTGLRTPLVAALYWLTVGFAKFARQGEVAGVVISEDVAARLEELARAPDKGKAARQELLALQILLARHFGYGGVHIGGFKQPGGVKAILDLADAIAARQEGPQAWWARWQEILRFDDGRPCRTGPAGGYYVFPEGPEGLNADSPPADTAVYGKSLMFRFMRVMHDLFFTGAMEPGGALNRLAALMGRTRPTAFMAYLLERAGKYPLLGCEGCGSCSLPETQYVCIQSQCAKKLPNGPCGGSTPEGECEAKPGKECAWLEIYRRAKAAGELDALVSTFVPAKDKTLQGTSSWINMATGRDHRGTGPRFLPGRGEAAEP